MLIDAFKHEFRFATLFYCFIHARNAIKRQLAERKYPESVAMKSQVKSLASKLAALM